MASEPMSESEARYIQRLPVQMERALQKVWHYHQAYIRYGMHLEDEAQALLRAIYGEVNPGQYAELQYQRARKG